MKPVLDLFAGLSAQFGKVSARERRLLAVLGLGLLLAAPIKAFDLYQNAQARNLAARAALDAQLSQARTFSAGGVGGQLARERAQIRAWSWQAASAPVGRVIAQDRIAAIAAHAGMTDFEVKAADKIEHVGGVDLVKVDIEAPFSWRGLSFLLAGLGDTGKGFLVESLTIQDGAKPRLKMSLKLPMTREAVS